MQNARRTIIHSLRVYVCERAHSLSLFSSCLHRTHRRRSIRITKSADPKIIVVAIAAAVTCHPTSAMMKWLRKRLSTTSCAQTILFCVCASTSEPYENSAEEQKPKPNETMLHSSFSIYSDSTSDSSAAQQRDQTMREFPPFAVCCFHNRKCNEQKKLIARTNYKKRQSKRVK